MSVFFRNSQSLPTKIQTDSWTDSRTDEERNLEASSDYEISYPPPQNESLITNPPPRNIRLIGECTQQSETAEIVVEKKRFNESITRKMFISWVTVTVLLLAAVCVP